MSEAITQAQKRRFAAAFLEDMNAAQAAKQAGVEDGAALLEDRTVQKMIRSRRGAIADTIEKEDVLRALTALAFGRANAAVELAWDKSKAAAQKADLSAVSEFKCHKDGSVEIKFVDRIRALTALYELLGNDDDGALEDLFHALGDAAAER